MWVDQTVKCATAPEITLQPDDTIELSWPITEIGSSRITFIIPVAAFREIIDKGRELLMVGAVGTAS